MAIDWTKPVRTVDFHWPMTVLTTERPNPAYPVVLMNPKSGDLLTCTPDGRILKCANIFVENVPEKHVAWLSLYAAVPYPTTKEAADSLAGDGRTACIRVEYEKGEGL